MTSLMLKGRNLIARYIMPNLIRAQHALTSSFEVRMRRIDAVVRYARGNGLELGAAATRRRFRSEPE